ncbi:MAG: hypothetical protein WC315_08740 [Candidatus Omnitrophota bacterium]|jgi:hypothetical protein
MVKLLTDDKTLGEDVLLCPVCKSDYVHIQSVEVITGKQATFIDSSGVKTTTAKEKLDQAKNERGTIIKIGLWCEENGHFGTLRLAFRKGNISVSADMVVAPDDLLHDIWRD